MKKRIIAAGLAAVLAMGCMTGCKSSTESKDTKSASANGKTEIEFWYSGGKTAVNVVQDIIDEYNASQDQYEVTAVTQADYDETYQKLQSAVAGKAAPDVVLLNADVTRALSDKGLVADLGSLMDEDGDFNREDYVQVFFDQGVDEDGKIFAMPAYGTTQVLYYNKAAFEAANIEPDSIKTWQDLSGAAAAIKATGEYEYGWEPMWGADNMIDAALSNGASVLSEDGKTVTINSEEWVEVWESFRTWIHDDKTMAVNSGGQGWEYWYNTIDDVLEGTAGGYTGSSGDQADLDFDIVAAMEQPAWDEDTESAPMAEAKLLSILESSSDEEKQGAYDFMRYFTNAQSQAQWTMSTGYVPVNLAVNDNEEYQAYVEENPQAAVPLAQASHGSVYPVDPTDGAIKDALNVAADKVELDGVSAKEALDEAQKTAQKALEEALAK